jgi:hypothetical protein
MTAIQRFSNTLKEMLREIFDENAYARFLAREGKPASVTAYAEFVKERYDAPVRRCC